MLDRKKYIPTPMLTIVCAKEDSNKHAHKAILPATDETILTEGIERLLKRNGIKEADAWHIIEYHDFFGFEFEEKPPIAHITAVGSFIKDFGFWGAVSLETSRLETGKHDLTYALLRLAEDTFAIQTKIISQYFMSLGETKAVFH